MVGQSVVICPHDHLFSSSQLVVMVRGVVIGVLEEPSFLGVCFDDA